jgi:hypothetical protein
MYSFLYIGRRDLVVDWQKRSNLAYTLLPRILVAILISVQVHLPILFNSSVYRFLAGHILVLMAMIGQSPISTMLFAC